MKTVSTKCRLQSINKKMDIIVKLTALQATKGRSFESRCKILNRFFSIKEISTLLGYSQKEVRKGLNNIVRGHVIDNC